MDGNACTCPDRLSDADSTERWEYISHDKLEGEEGTDFDECDSAIKADHSENDRSAGSAQVKVESTSGAGLLSSLDRLADVSVFRILSEKSSNEPSDQTITSEWTELSTDGDRQKYKTETTSISWKYSSDHIDASFNRVQTGERRKSKDLPEKPYLLQTEAQKNWTGEKREIETRSEMPSNLKMTESDDITVPSVSSSKDSLTHKGSSGSVFTVLAQDKSGLVDREDSSDGKYLSYSYRMAKGQSGKSSSNAVPQTLSEKQASESNSIKDSAADWSDGQISSKSTSSFSEKRFASQSGQEQGYATEMLAMDKHATRTIGENLSSLRDQSETVVKKYATSVTDENDVSLRDLSETDAKKSAQPSSAEDNKVWFSSFYRKNNEVESGLSSALANVLLNREAQKGKHSCLEELYSHSEIPKEGVSDSEPSEVVMVSANEDKADEESDRGNEVAKELMKQIDLIQKDIRDSMASTSQSDESGTVEDISKADLPSENLQQAGTTLASTCGDVNDPTAKSGKIANGQDSSTSIKDTTYFASQRPVGTYYETMDIGLAIINDGNEDFANSSRLRDDSLGLAFNSLEPASLQKDAQAFGDFPVVEDESKRNRVLDISPGVLTGEKEPCNGAVGVGSRFSQFDRSDADSKERRLETELNVSTGTFAGTSSPVQPIGTASNHALLSLLEPGLIDGESDKPFDYVKQEGPTAQKGSKTSAQCFAKIDESSTDRLTSLPFSFDEQVDTPKLRSVWPAELGSHEADAYISELKGVAAEEKGLKTEGRLMGNSLSDESPRDEENVSKASPVDTSELSTSKMLTKEAHISQSPTVGREQTNYDGTIKKNDKDQLQDSCFENDNLHMIIRDSIASLDRGEGAKVASSLSAENQDSFTPGSVNVTRSVEMDNWSHGHLMEPDEFNVPASVDTGISEARALHKVAFDGNEGAIAAAKVKSDSTATASGISDNEREMRLCMKKPEPVQLDFVDGANSGEQADNEVSVFVTAGYANEQGSAAAFPRLETDKSTQKQMEVNVPEQAGIDENQRIDLRSSANRAFAQTEKWVPENISTHPISSFGYTTTSEMYTVGDVETFVSHDFVYKQPDEGSDVLRYTDDCLVDTSASKTLALQTHSASFEIQKNKNAQTVGDSEVVDVSVPHKLVESTAVTTGLPTTEVMDQTGLVEDREDTEMSDLALPQKDGRAPSFLMSNNEPDIGADQAIRKSKRAKRNRRGNKTKQDDVSSPNMELVVETMPNSSMLIKDEPKGEWIKEGTTAVSHVTLVRSEAVQSVETNLNDWPKAPSITSSFSSSVSADAAPSFNAQEGIPSQVQISSSTSAEGANSSSYGTHVDQLSTDGSSQCFRDSLRAGEKEHEGPDEYTTPAKDDDIETTCKSLQMGASNRGRGVLMRKSMSVDVSSRRGRLSRPALMRSSILEMLGAEDVHHAVSQLATLDEVSNVMRKAGLESSNLIFGIDYTASNKYQGEHTFGGRSLHAILPEISNPYQQILGKTLQPFSSSGFIAAYGFGDVKTSDLSVFPLKKTGRCRNFEEVLDVYNKVTPGVILSGPTNFAPLIHESINICKEEGSYHILVIVADGQVTNEKETRDAILTACKYPLSIIVVGVGDGPWEMMRVFDESLPRREWDNFHFVDFHGVVSGADKPESAFALESLLEIPDQYTRIKALKLL
ncbi:Copine [Trichuris suis]|nr:Copine [Trichuris suis]